MRAIVWTKYGPPDGLELREVEKPTPKRDEVLIRIRATTVSAGDCEMRSLRFPLWLRLPLRVYNGIRRPRRITILGQELAGEVESIGTDVTRFRQGDQVFAALGLSMGAYAEYICLPEDAKEMEGVLAHMPSNLSCEEAAAVPVGGLNALHFLDLARIRRGETVLINGAGGSIGTVAVQLAKHAEAEVTAVDSTGKLDMLREIGADHVVDYTREDFAARGRTYDVIFDVVGKASLPGCMRSLKKDGRLLIAYPKLLQMARGRWASMRSGKRVIGGSVSYRRQELIRLKKLIEEGAIRPVVDRCYPLEEISDAHRFVEAGGKKGNVAITVS